MGFVGFTLLPESTVHAQLTQDMQLADQYFKNGEFDKAVVLYEKTLE
jgi:hypothetical protein